MDDDSIKLPGSVAKPPSHSQAFDFFTRKGRVIPPKKGAALPVTLDADAMEQLVQELLKRENDQRLETEMEDFESAMLPPSAMQNMLPPGTQ